MDSECIGNKNDEFINYLKINIFGETGVGKSSLISLMDNYSNYNFEIKNDLDKSNDSLDSFNTSKSLVEQIKRIVIDLNEDRNLFFNIYETNIDSYDTIKTNLDILLIQTECVIIMWDNSKPESFDNIPNLVSIIEKGIKQNKYNKVPVFVIQNKIDITQDENEEDDLKEFIEKFKKENKNIIYKEISLLNKNEFYSIVLDIYQSMNILEESKFKGYYSKDFNIVKYKHPIKKEKEGGNNNDIIKMNIKILGDSSVGKTSFINYLMEKNNNNINPTIMAKFRGEEFYIEIKEEILCNNLYKDDFGDVDGILLFFDVGNQKSFDIIKKSMDSIVNYFGDKDEFLKLILIANKIDENDERVINKKDIKKLADKNDIKYIECSCLNGLNVYEIFNEIIVMSYDRYNQKYIEKRNKKKKINKYLESQIVESSEIMSNKKNDQINNNQINNNQINIKTKIKSIKKKKKDFSEIIDNDTYSIEIKDNKSYKNNNSNNKLLFIYIILCFFIAMLFLFITIILYNYIK